MLCRTNEDNSERSYLSAVTHLLKLIDPLCSLDSDLEETQDPSHDVDNSVRDLRRGADVTDVSAGVVKHEGFAELGRNALGELRRRIKTVFPRKAIELLVGQV